jgi:pectin methylesterase-like acyl-CoA thioesterase
MSSNRYRLCALMLALAASGCGSSNDDTGSAADSGTPGVTDATSSNDGDATPALHDGSADASTDGHITPPDGSVDGGAGDAPAAVDASGDGPTASDAGDAAADAGDGSTGPTDAGDSGVVAPGFVPVKGETAAYIDTRLQITFDSPPKLGTTGHISIYTTNDALVDTLDVSNAVAMAYDTQTIISDYDTEIDALGYVPPPDGGSPSRARYVYYTPVTISGNTATIVPHNNRLTYGTQYYVVVDASVFTGTLTIAGAPYQGVAKTDGWSFTTKAAPTSPTTVVVDDNGVADFRTVQGALNWMMTNGCSACPSAAASKTVTIMNGTYEELLFLRDVSNLTIAGESRAGVTVQYSNYDSYNPGSGGSSTTPGTTLSNGRRSLGGGRAVFLVELGDMLKLTNFTLHNERVRVSGFNNQAETIYFNSGNRLIGEHMNFVSMQDTLLLKGWDWFYDSYVAGSTDFIWGYPQAALFESSELHTVVDTESPTSGGFVMQSRAYYGVPGFVVLNSTLTSDSAVPAGSTYLARSSGQGTSCVSPSGYNCDDVAYVNTRMGPHVATVGWYTTPAPTPSTATDTTGWREYGSMDPSGQPLNVSGRSSDSAQITASGYSTSFSTRAEVFAAWSNGAGWSPTP